VHREAHRRCINEARKDGTDGDRGHKNGGEMHHVADVTAIQYVFSWCVWEETALMECELLAYDGQTIIYICILRKATV
jgi:hypothetical protein